MSRRLPPRHVYQQSTCDQLGFRKDTNAYVYGSSIPDYSFYHKRFIALGRRIGGLKPLKRVKPFYPKAKALGLYGLGL